MRVLQIGSCQYNQDALDAMTAKEIRDLYKGKRDPRHIDELLIQLGKKKVKKESPQEEPEESPE